MNQTFFCSFCGKSQHDVTKLIAGPTVFICVECVDLCHEILHPPAKPLPPTAGDPPRLCKDCRWAKMDDRYFRMEGSRLWVCLHADATYMPKPDYVTGVTQQLQYISCSGMREGICGSEGKLWEPCHPNDRDSVIGFSDVIGFGEALRDPDEPK